MEKRVLIAVGLSFLVLYSYQALFPSPAPKPAPAAVSGTPAGQDGTGQPAAAAAEAPGQAAQPAAAPSAGDAPVVADAAERDIVVENAAVHAVFTTRGGSLKSWTLKKYLTHGAPLDLIPQIVRGAPLPFTLRVEDARTSSVLRNAFYKPSADSLDVSSQSATLTFQYTNAAGLAVTKSYAFDPAHPYAVTFDATVTENGTPLDPSVQFGPALGTGIIERSGTYNPPSQPIFYKDGSVTRVKSGKIHETPSVTGIFGFVGVDDHYFLTAALPSNVEVHAEFEPVTVPVEGTKDGAHFVSWTTHATTPHATPYFLGPKDFDILASVQRDLVRTIDFGMFAAIVVPLLRALKWVNGYVGNFGWSIIVLTILINLVMFPLRHKSVVSMRRMAEIQPEVKAIQERYAKYKVTDPERQKMNTELMNLYRKQGVNPASGCVPMILTFPVLFAFYAMLSVAIELRGAPFVGWIHDLSAHDPLFITPVIMGVTMLVQQKMTPSTADPAQQKMMMFMPLVFLFMFLWAPVGLVLYWTVSNLWAIGQQAITNRIIGPMPQRVVRPPAERQLKNAGTGKTAAVSKERK